MDERYLYIPELDSVRTSKYEQLAGEQALYKALVLEGRKVALSYNQVIDSVAFLHLFEDGWSSKEALLDFFQEGRIYINQDETDMNLSKYVQDRYADKKFISSYLDFLKDPEGGYPYQTRDMVIKELVRCIQYDDPIRLRKELENDKYLKNDDKMRIETYALTILKINRLIYDSKCYIEVKPLCQRKYSSMIDVVKEMEDRIKECIPEKPHYFEIWRKMRAHMCYHLFDDRSRCYRFIERSRGYGEITKTEEKQLKALIDLAYTIKVIDSTLNCEPLGPIDDEITIALERADQSEMEKVNPVLGKVDWKKMPETVKVAESVLDWPLIKGIWKKTFLGAALKNIGYGAASFLIIFGLFCIGETLMLVTDFAVESVSMGVVAAVLFSFASSTLTGNFQKKTYSIMPSWSALSFSDHFKNIIRNLKISKQAREIIKYETKH